MVRAIRHEPIKQENDRLGFVGIAIWPPIARRLLESGFKLTPTTGTTVRRRSNSIWRTAAQSVRNFPPVNIVLSCLPAMKRFSTYHRGPEGILANAIAARWHQHEHVYPETSQQLSRLGQSMELRFST